MEGNSSVGCGDGQAGRDGSSPRLSREETEGCAIDDTPMPSLACGQHGESTEGAGDVWKEETGTKETDGGSNGPTTPEDDLPAPSAASNSISGGAERGAPSLETSEGGRTRPSRLARRKQINYTESDDNSSATFDCAVMASIDDYKAASAAAIKRSSTRVNNDDVVLTTTPTPHHQHHHHNSHQQPLRTSHEETHR